MDIVPLQKEFIPAAADLFVQNFKRLRTRLPILPYTLEDHDRIAGRLSNLPGDQPGVAALDNGELVGYLGAFLVDRFRGAHRKGAYCPVWAHGAQEGAKPMIYPALYRAAAGQWTAAGCRVHAISLLAHDKTAQQSWFWSGFGLAVVDSIRSLDALPGETVSSFSVRQAVLADVATLVQIEAEHCQHYPQSPIFMASSDCGSDAEAFAKMLSTGHNSVWLAQHKDETMAYLQFEEKGRGATDIVNDETTIAITGAYTRPDYRGQGVAKAVLNMALKHYAAQNFKRCSVDFESFNPEAATFWMKYFEPFCLSVMRIPESIGQV